MLVLTRKLDESIVIADNITVKVLEIGSNRVRLGIDAPAEIPVNRAEVQKQAVSTQGVGGKSLEEIGCSGSRPCDLPSSIHGGFPKKPPTAALGLHEVLATAESLQRQLNQGSICDADAITDRLVGQLRQLSRFTESSRSVNTRDAARTAEEGFSPGPVAV